MWAEDARKLFQATVGKILDYLLKSSDNRTIHSNKRFYTSDAAKKENVFFDVQVAQNQTYDAFEKDIAMVKFYFEKSRAVQFQRKASNNWFSFMSQVGGNAGLGVGFSFISAVEIIYWLTIRLVQNYLTKRQKSSKRTK